MSWRYLQEEEEGKTERRANRKEHEQKLIHAFEKSHVASEVMKIASVTARREKLRRKDAFSSFQLKNENKREGGKMKASTGKFIAAFTAGNFVKSARQAGGARLAQRIRLI